jgi:dipeptidyl aminopeptidase/acylaminoacyl peptidase
MAGLILALALAAQPAAPAAGPAPTSPGLPAQVRLYHEVTISPDGAQIASVEADDVQSFETEPHEAVVIRMRATGEVVARFDPCAACFYSGPAGSPDSQSLAFVATNRRARLSSLQIARSGKAATALDFTGLLATPRWSPDGRTMAVLATNRPRKQTGAT